MRFATACMICVWATTGWTVARADSPTTASAPAIPDLTWLLADAPGAEELLRPRRVSLEAQIERAASPIDRAAAQLTLANWLLSVPAAAAATRVLVGLPADDDPATLAGIGQSAQVHISQARQALAVYQRDTASDLPTAEAPGALAGQRLQSLEGAAEALSAFASVFAFMATKHPSLDAEEGWSRVARGLAGPRESADGKLAACAAVWQAFAWLRAGRTDRALGMLPQSLQPTTQPDYDFMARLLRCQILSALKQDVAVLSLLTRLRGVCIPLWFEAESDELRAARQRLVMLMQMYASTTYQARLREAGSTSAADSHTQTMADLAGQLAKLNPTDLTARAYRLEAAVPVLLESTEQGSSNTTAVNSTGGILTASSAALVTTSQPVSTKAE